MLEAINGGDHLRARSLNPVAVTITASQETTFKDGVWRVPKRDLLRPLITAIESGQLKVARNIPDADAFLRELKAFSVTTGEWGHVMLEGRGEHDDFPIAVALALWWATPGFALIYGQTKGHFGGVHGPPPRSRPRH